MSLSERLARLTPEQRAHLESRLKTRQQTVNTPLSTIARRSDATLPPLSFGQERLWFLDQLEDPSAIYNICYAGRLHGSIDVVNLERVLVEIVRRHEPLRTTFPPSSANQPPHQKISETVDFRLQIIDLTATLESEKEKTLRNTVETIARVVMPLAKGPLFRVHLLKIAPEDHVLMVVMHHIISDGWSLDVFLRELSTLYADFVAGRSPSVTPLEIQYADFAAWQRRELQGAELQRHVSYWKDQLAGAAPVLNLPTDFPRPSEQSYRGAYCGKQIGSGLTEKINQLCRKTETTPFMVLLAAFKILLHRYSGQTDILVGSPVSNRARVELEPLIGFFVNMLVLRTTFTGDSTAREVIQQIRQSTLGALAHQSLSFEKLVQELQPVRDLSYTPFFQVALMFQQEEAKSFQLPGVKIETIPATTATAKFDLTLYANESKQGLSLSLEYATDLFTAATAERLLAHLECLLESMVAQTDTKVAELNLLRSEDRRQILLDWNHTAIDYPKDKTVHQLFAEQAARTPNAIAVEFGRQRLSYRDLARRADALAATLRNKGVTIETHVGIYVERSIDMVVGVLGILQAGGTYVPLDPAFPKDRLAFMVEDAKIPVILTQERLLKEVPANQAQIVLVDDQSAASTPNPNSSPSGPENLAYILFTSGSTGRPKGVQIPHRAVVNFLNAMRRAPGLTANDVLLAVTTLSFDIAGLELFLPLTTGARIVIASREEAIDGARLAQMMKSSGITVMQATPATWRMLLDAGWEGDSELKILCGGEAIDRALADRLLTRCGELWNMYGPTETTIWSTTERLMPGRSITIGRPIDNTQTYILDEKSGPVPPGVSGELYIGGDGVARGYLNRPELTAEKFVPDPFATDNKQRLYRTGDLARYCADGRIEFLGRSDFQVKIRGFRIEIGEIETALNAIAGVAQAVVKVHDDTLGGKRLVGYIVPKMPETAAAAAPGVKEFSPAFDVAALRNQLRSHLPDYMIPPAFVFLEAFPLTPNGKVDRKALPEPDKMASQEARYESPVGPIEEKLAGIMAALLRLPKVGRSDDFFALGGYSILAVSLFNEVERVLGKRIPLATLFRAPTVAALAAEIEKETVATKRWNSLVSIQVSGSKPRFFCVHGAGGNILLYRDLAHYLGPDYPFYGLQSQGLDKQTQPLTTVEAMAERYLDEIRALQPQGPYCIGGYCLGGTIAYEMAQRLRQEGHEVALLALFDTYNFTRMDQAKALPFVWQKLTFHARNLAGLSWRDLSGYISSKVRVATDGELRSLWKNFSKSSHHKDASGTLEINVQETNDAAASAYRPKSYSGKVTVFKPKVNYDFFPDPKMGWGENVQGELDIVALPINPHAMLVAPFVKHLVVELRRRIDLVGSQTEQKSVAARS